MWNEIFRGIVTILALLWFSSLAAAESLTVTVEAHGEHPPEVALLEAYAPEEDIEPWTADVSLISGRGRATLDLPMPPEGTWHLRLSAEGFWAADVAVSPDLENLARVDLWPAGTLRSTLRTPADGKPPEALELALTAASEEDDEEALNQPEQAVISCAVVEEALAPCRVPAGTWHLRAKASEYVARYRWGLRIPAAEEVDLGRLVLEKGASLIGRVVTVSGPADPEEARIQLRPLMDRHDASEEERRELEQLTLTEKLNPWGYFHFEGVAPGSYEIVARQTGFTPAQRAPVSVSKGDSVELAEPLVLEPPARLALSVFPSESPSGEPWDVMFLGRDRFGQLEVVAEGPTQAGRWTSPPVSPGPYSVRVLNPAGDPVAWHDVELHEPRQPLEIDLDLVRVEGKVLLGEKPLAAELRLGGRDGVTKVEATSDEEGEFQVIVPRAEAWIADVSAEDPVVHAKDVDVEIETDTDRKAEVVIELPDTAIRGNVVDSRGVPRAGATVSLLQMDEQPKITRTRTGEDGSFELHGQEPGRWFLEAEAGDAQSIPREVNLTEGSTTGPLRLVLKEDRPLAGRIRGPSGAVPQAVIFGIPVTSSGMPAVTTPHTRSGTDGAFELELPADSVAARLVVFAPGFALHVERVPMDAEQPVVLELRQEGGRLVLTRPPEEGHRAPLLLVDGQPLDFLKLPLLRRWARTNGVDPAREGALAIPAMPSGLYAYCQVTMDEALLVLSGAALPKASACSEGFLSPNGELELAVSE